MRIAGPVRSRKRLPAATARRSASIDAGVQAKNVYLVLSPPKSGRGTVEVLVDGRPAGPRVAGADVHGGRVTVTSQRLYRLVDLPVVERHRLRLELQPGISGYAFTFG